MTLCAQCGSIRIEPAPPEGLDQVVAFFTGKRRFVCFRCGWEGRRNWTDEDLKALADYGAGGAEPDPELIALDEEALKRARRKAQNRGNRKRSKAKPKPVPDTFGFDALVLTSAQSGVAGLPGGEGNAAPATALPRSRTTRRKPSRIREIVPAIVVSVLVMLLVGIVVSADSCSSVP